MRLSRLGLVVVELMKMVVMVVMTADVFREA